MTTLAERALVAIRSRMRPAIAPARRILEEGSHLSEASALRMREGRMWSEDGAILVRLEPPKDAGPVRVDDLDAPMDLPSVHSLVLHLSAVASATRIRGPQNGDVSYLAFADGPRTAASANLLRLEAEATYRRDMKALGEAASSIHAQLSDDFRLGERSLLFGRDGPCGEISTVASRDPATRGIHVGDGRGGAWVVLVSDWKGARSTVGLHPVRDPGTLLADLSAGRVPRTPFGMRFGPDMLPPDADVLALCEAARRVSDMVGAFEAVRPLLDPAVTDDGTFSVLDETALAWAEGFEAGR